MWIELVMLLLCLNDSFEYSIDAKEDKKVWEKN